MKPFPYDGPTDIESVLSGVAHRAQEFDVSGNWPTLDLQALTAAGATRWAVPKEFQGDGLSPVELHLCYERLAAASLATALILTQRDSAVHLLVAADRDAPKRELMLGRAASGSHWSTVGIAQLTTSRQGVKSALTARRVDRGYELNGLIPWCTGAVMSPFIVAGATIDSGPGEGQQILFVMQNHLAGLTIDLPMQLVALSSTFTTSMRLHNVLIEDPWLLRGPSKRALVFPTGHLPFGQIFLAFGLCRSAIDLIKTHTSSSAQEAADRFDSELTTIRTEVLSLCEPDRLPEAAAASPRLRSACNDLAIRITSAAVAIFKGSALLRSHPAQRLAREAMFLLVWSCPDPVIECTVDRLTDC